MSPIPRSPLLIALNGFKHSGKNTAAKVIAQWGAARGLQVVERAFADTLKLSAARSLGLATNYNDAIVLMDSLKENGAIEIDIPEQSLARSITGREFLKWYGTEGHRDVFGKDFWVDWLLPLEQPWSYNFVTPEDDVPDIGVITDLRFANEGERVRMLGGYVWNIDRGLPGDEHASEQPLPKALINTVIDNHSTLEAFEVNVNSEMTAQFHMMFVEQEEPAWDS